MHFVISSALKQLIVIVVIIDYNSDVKKTLLSRPRLWIWRPRPL